MVNGFAEALKHALIKDPGLWDEFSSMENLSELSSDEMLMRISSIKVEIVNSDPYEKGLRKILNFGHTVGHAIEGYFLFREPVDHGHGVALGMIAESYISYRKGILAKTTFEQIEKVVDQYKYYKILGNLYFGLFLICSISLLKLLVFFSVK